MSGNATDCNAHSSRTLTVVVLLGGWSSERAISLASGQAVIHALRSRGHDVRQLDPADIDLFTYPWAGIDAAFVALHGSFGEDGTVQTLLDQLRVPYSGSGSAASRLAISKSSSKQRFLARRLPTPAYRTGHVVEPADSIHRKAGEIGYPLVVKPDSQGSSIGVSIVAGPEQLQGALELAFAYDPLTILEQFIPGRELTVAVLERTALAPIEIRPARPFFDYEAKYEDADTAYVWDLDLPPDTAQRISTLAVTAVDELDCCGVTRVDLRLDPENRPWLLEVNTIPGLTDHSLVPKAAARAGLSLGELCEQLLVTKISRAAETEGRRAA
jgi:D-alanine-D-alanine ligase